MQLDEYLLQHYSHRGTQRYKNLIHQFVQWRGKENIPSTSYQYVVEYIGLLRQRDLHPKTIKLHLFAVKIYFRYLVTIGKRSDHPCEDLYLKDQINRAILVESLYSMETLEALYDHFETPEDRRPGRERSEAIKKRDKIIVSLLIYQALTCLEIIELKIEDINLEEGTIRIRPNEHPNRRGNKGRALALKPKQILLFHEYLKKLRKELWKKQKPRHRVDYFILNESGLQFHGAGIHRLLTKCRKPHERYTPMKIRQSVIVHLLKEKNDIRIVQEFAGHRRAGSTEAYKRTGLEELKASIEKLHPHQV